NVTNVTVNLLEPGTRYGDRINQLDFRVAKLFRFGGKRTMVGLDLYNALNSNAILTYNNTFVPGGTWLQPRAILTPRMFRISGEYNVWEDGGSTEQAPPYALVGPALRGRRPGLAFKDPAFCIVHSA